MPAQRPCAAFEPISPDLDLTALVESTPNFEFAVRIHCDAIDEQGLENFEKLVLLHVVLGGKPLVIEGYDRRLEKWIFSEQWLRDNYSTKTEIARNLTTKSNLPLSIGHYLNSMALLTDQWNAENYKDPNRQRIYLKDIDCPPVWREKLEELIPPLLFYLNESTGDVGGPGAPLEPNPNGPGMRIGRGIAKAGDLMSSLPPEMRADNLMCYIGHEGTYTPSHREMCATLGHNIMVEASTGLVEHGKPTKPGSSIWFMTESKDRHLVSEYWLSTLGHDIEIENHFAQINAWKAAPFKTYVVEQKVGDFIIIPPLAPHQVWNRGTRTMKVAWNRTTVETLELALNEALQRARMVCRDEQYKNKAIVFYSLDKYSDLLRRVSEQKLNSPRIRQLQKDFRRLFSLYTQILLSESFSRDRPEEKNIQFLPFDSNVTCAYCRCNIFNRFLTCPSCIGTLPSGEEDNYDICMECYAMGRSCACISKLKWVEQFRWKELTEKHETWRQQILSFSGQLNEYPQPLHIERDRLGKRTLAQICQEELKRRPWVDITKPVARIEDANDDVDVDDEGRVKKRRKIRRSDKWRKEHGSCHICKTQEPTWKLASCTSCGLNYCYGSLFRAFDIMPQKVMEEYYWKCPKCLKICSCGACRRDPTMTPFEPTGTLLGNDTRKIADPRSVESLVDFSHSNIVWLKKAGDDHPHDTRRLRKRQEEAEKAKLSEPNLNEHYIEQTSPGAVEVGILRLAEYEGVPIDHGLGSGSHGDGQHLDGQEESRLPIDPALDSTHEIQQPQLLVPKNGVLRKDMENEYEATEVITFEYPDPEGPSVTPIPSAETCNPHSMVPETAQELSQQSSESVIKVTGRKRRRPNEHVKVQNGFQLTYDGAGDIPDERAQSQETRNVSKSPASDGGKNSGSATIIQSDIIPLDAESGSFGSQSRRRKILRIRGEYDDDFTPTKGYSRRARPRKSTSKTRKRRVGCSEDSEVSSGELDDHSHNETRPAQGRRNPPRSTKRLISDCSDVENSQDISEHPSNTQSDRAAASDSQHDAVQIANDGDNEYSPLIVGENRGGVPQSSPSSSYTPEVVGTAYDNTSVNANGPGSQSKRSHLVTEAEKNRRAKIMAMQWAEGDYEDLGGEAWLSSEETQAEPFDIPRENGRNRPPGSIPRGTGRRTEEGRQRRVNSGMTLIFT
ncbi:hypothetical protein VTN00DRAFT_5976 [Thermoascus crustaceus]|uniref:uncharacterized protein n=1 Tax=Thermoascus crustaceus TaxID=5088 RepID=UPI003742D51F